MGGYEAGTPVSAEPSLKYHPPSVWLLTCGMHGHRLAGSLTGVVASKRVTEASSVVFETATKYCISDSFVDYNGYSIPSKGFWPTVVFIMVI